MTGSCLHLLLDAHSSTTTAFGTAFAYICYARYRAPHVAASRRMLVSFV